MVIVLTTIVGALFSGGGITVGAAGGEYNPTGKGEPQWVQYTGSPENYAGRIYDYLPDEEKLIYDAIDECLTGESGEAFFQREKAHESPANYNRSSRCPHYYWGHRSSGDH